MVKGKINANIRCYHLMPAPGVEAVCGPEVSLDPSSSWMGMSREQKYLEMNQSEVSTILDQPITVEYNSPEDVLGEGSCAGVEASCSLKAESLGHLAHHHLLTQLVLEAAPGLALEGGEVMLQRRLLGHV